MLTAIGFPVAHVVNSAEATSFIRTISQNPWYPEIEQEVWEYNKQVHQHIFPVALLLYINLLKGNKKNDMIV